MTRGEYCSRALRPSASSYLWAVTADVAEATTSTIARLSYVDVGDGVRLTDFVAAWTDSDLMQRGRLITSILSEVLVKDRRIAGIRPRPGWAPYFEELLRTIGSRERETGLEPATACLEGRCSTS